MDISRKTKSEAKSVGMSPTEMATVDLIVLGWNPMDAYKVAMSPPITTPDEFINERVEALMAKENIKEYITSKQKSIASSFEKYLENPTTQGAPLLEKEDVLQELLRIAMTMPANSKERADIMMKYASLQQMQKEKVTEEDTTIHYYLPLSCYNCELYQKRKKNENKHNPKSIF